MVKLTKFANDKGQIWAYSRYKIYEAPNASLVASLISSFLIRASRLNSFISIH